MVGREAGAKPKSAHMQGPWWGVGLYRKRPDDQLEDLAEAVDDLLFERLLLLLRMDCGRGRNENKTRKLELVKIQDTAGTWCWQ